MIGQHMLMRCINGAYSSSKTAGFKTAAVSKSIAAMSSGAQSELDREIIMNAAVPDALTVGGTPDNNRGIVHWIPYKDLIFLMRIRRVSDLCTYSGTVSFVQTYILSGSEKQVLLKYPELLTELERFDRYSEVDKRCGGLSGASPISVNEQLDLLSDPPEFNSSCLEEAGFDRESFARLISAVCVSICRNTYIDLIPKNVSPSDWQTEGGSLSGERLIAAILRLLPDFLSARLSCTSYWNDDPEYSGLDGIKLRVLSGARTDGLKKSYVSLYDLKNGDISDTNAEPGAFGRRLWELRNDREGLEGFHAAIDEVLGEKGGQMIKLPEVMDMLTEAVMYREGRAVDHRGLLCRLLSNIGSSLPEFPELDRIAGELINEAAADSSDVDEELEQLFLEMTEECGGSWSHSSGMAACLLSRIERGISASGTAERMAELVPADDTVRREHERLMDRLVKTEKSDVSQEFVRYLLALVPAAEKDRTIAPGLFELLDTIYSTLRNNGELERCIAICSYRIESSSDEGAVSKNAARLIGIIKDTADKPGIRSAAAEAFTGHLGTYARYSGMSTQLAKTLFGAEEHSEYADDGLLFPIFVRLLAQCSDDEDYCIRLWTKQYIDVLSRHPEGGYSEPERYLEGVTGDSWFTAMKCIELSRVEALPEHVTSWETLDRMTSGLTGKNEAEIQNKAFNILRQFVNWNQKKKKGGEILSGIKGTDRIYDYYYRLCGEKQAGEDEKELVLSVIGSELSGSGMRQAVQGFADNADTRDRAAFLGSDILSIWNAVYKPNEHKEEKNYTINSVLELDRIFSERNNAEAVMSRFDSEIKRFCNSSDSIAKADNDLVEMLFRGLEQYNWKKALDKRATSDILFCRAVDEVSDKNDKEVLGQLKDYNAELERSHLDCPLKRCALRIQSFIRDNDKPQNTNDPRMKERLTLFATAYLLVEKPVDKHKANEYLTLVRGTDSRFYDGEYLILGIAHVLASRRDSRQYKTLITSMTDALVKVISSLTGTEGDNRYRSILTCRNIYRERVQKMGFREEDQRKLKSAASNTGLPELCDIFTIEVYEKNDDTEKSHRMDISASPVLIYTAAAILAVLVAIILILLWLFKPAFSAAAAVVFCAASAVLYIYIRRSDEQ
ncbi:MAG: hypothetical protein IJ874_03280 [Ruminococcus sp.]|nr:hypothetical protein [Ruminococcus sp.]